jgi:hypothetical protein
MGTLVDVYNIGHVLSRKYCNMPIIIPDLINDYVDIMCGYNQSDVICKFYLFVLLVKCDASC